MKLRLAVTGIGTLSPIGLTGLVALHSIRSGVSRLSMQPHPDRLREWVVGGAVPKWIAELRERRLLALAVDAVGAALSRAEVELGDSNVGRTTALILGSAESFRPGYRFPPVGQKFGELIEDTPLAAIEMIEVMPAGSCSAQSSLIRASELFATTSIRRCVIGAVDTQLQLRTIRWHEDNFRLKCSYLTDGLMPAEAASFVVVEPEESALERGARIIARIASVNTAREHSTILSDRPNTAAGLTTAVRATLDEAGIRSSDVGMVWSDLNGESYRAREWAFTETRLGFNSNTELMHPADCHGDLGAATDANLLALATLCHGTGWSEGKPALVFSGSDGGLRAATMLTPAEGVQFLLHVTTAVPRVLSTTFHLPAPPDTAESFRSSKDPSRAYFEWQLREEHRDELASLHYQRMAILRDRTIPWPRLREPEQRMLNHLDAAVASGPASMTLMAAGLDADEEGLCFAGAFLIGALPTEHNFALMDVALDQPSGPRLAGIAAGLLHAPDSEALRRFVQRMIDGEDPAVQAMATIVAGARRIDIRARLPLLARGHDADLARAAADACGRLRVDEAITELQMLLGHERQDVRKAAVFALLRTTRDNTAAAYARAHIVADADFDGALAICLGVSGQLRDVAILIEHSRSDPKNLGAIEALGILGSARSVPHLLSLLESDDDEIKVAAATALDLMAGLHARERASVTAPSDPGDISAEEHEVERVNTSADFWTSWWHTQLGRLDTNVRWRRGDYFTIGSCIDEMADPLSNYTARTRAYLEVTARAAHDIPFEPDWFVPHQERAISAWRSWWAVHRDR